MQGKVFPDVRVAMREVELEDSLFPDGRVESNSPVRIYDCSGSWGDENYHGDLEVGLPRLRQKWITDRQDTEAQGESCALEISIIRRPRGHMRLRGW